MKWGGIFIKHFFMNPSVFMGNDVWTFSDLICVYEKRPVYIVSTKCLSYRSWFWCLYFPHIQTNCSDVSVRQYKVRTESLCGIRVRRWDWHSQWVKLEHLPLYRKLSWGRKLAFNWDQPRKSGPTMCPTKHPKEKYCILTHFYWCEAKHCCLIFS